MNALRKLTDDEAAAIMQSREPDRVLAKRYWVSESLVARYRRHDCATAKRIALERGIRPYSRHRDLVLPIRGRDPLPYERRLIERIQAGEE